MSLNADAIRIMVASGMSAEEVLAVAEALEAGGKAASKGAERTRRWRERKAEAESVTRDVTVTHHGDDDPLSLPPSPQTPQPPTHTRECVSTRTRKADDFERFWAVYPRREAKAAARKAFDRALVRAGDVETLLAAIERQRTWDQWQRGFIPHPATWLNQERWTDEEPPPSTPAPRKPHERPSPDSRREARNGIWADIADQERGERTRLPAPAD